MLYIHVEAARAHNAELQRVADRARRHRAPRFAHGGSTPPIPRRQASRPLRAAAAAVATRVAR